MCRHVVNKLPLLMKYVPDKCKTQQICYKAFLVNGGMLMFIPDCYRDQIMYNKAVDNYPHALKSVPDCYKTQKIVIRLSVLIFLQYNLFLINLRLKKCVIKLSILNDLYLILFLIDI